MIKAKKRRRIAFFGIRGGLAPSPVFIKDGFKKVTLLILLGFMRCLPTYVLLALRPVGYLGKRSPYLGIRIAYKTRDECFRASLRAFSGSGPEILSA